MLHTTDMPHTNTSPPFFSGTIRRSIYLAALVLAIVTETASSAGPLSPAARWTFDELSERIEDQSGHGFHGKASNCERTPSPFGHALKLDGSNGMLVSDSPQLRSQRGFTFACRIQLAPGPERLMYIFGKADEFMLRIDPPQAGGSLSLFVNTADGTWDPRARGPRLEPGRWYDIVGSWNGRTLRLWVNRSLTSVVRQCTCSATKAPLTVGSDGEAFRPGFRGLIDELQYFNRPLPPHQLAALAYGFDSNEPAVPRTDASFDFTDGNESWTGSGDLRPSYKDGALNATFRSANDLLSVSGLSFDAASHPICTARLAGSQRGRGVLLFVSDTMFKEVPFRLIADGKVHDYTIRCGTTSPWDGNIHALGLRIESDGPCSVTLETLHMAATSHAPPDLRIAALAPERRCGKVGEPMRVTAWVRNLGGTTRRGTATLNPPPGVSVQGQAGQSLRDLGFDEVRQLEWQIKSFGPADGEIELCVRDESGNQVKMVRPVCFVEDPEIRTLQHFRKRTWQQAGYPRAMDFRHVFPDSIAFHEHNTAFLIDFIDGKIEAARELKRRYPDRLVLMQVNDENNGIWGSWHVVPRAFAVKEGLTFDPVVFPMPEFRGYWLLGPRATLTSDWSADAETIELPVSETQWFVFRHFGHEYLQDVLVVRRSGGVVDWTHSEYASVIAVDHKAKSITLRRWPRNAIGDWKSFDKDSAFVAPSVGSIYKLFDGPTIKTWIPNLTRFCPRDPATGLNATQWWARHFARLWHERIARDAPHPDGLQFDGLDQRAFGDCDLDGVVDGCELRGIDYWRLGLYDFARLLRSGTAEWKGMGDALIAVDASSANGPRLPALFNGSEDEEFPGFGGPAATSSAFDLYRVWCGHTAGPKCSYLQSRFHCESYIEDDAMRLRERGKLHPDGFVRLGIALACMDQGIHTYRTGSRRDILAINRQAEILEYPWDEYYAGRAGTFNWLGVPASDAIRKTDHLGPNLLPDTSSPDGWQLTATNSNVKATDPLTVKIAEHVAVQATVLEIDTTGLPRVNPSKAAAQVVLESPATTQSLDPAKEYCVEFVIAADPQEDDIEGERYKGIMRRVAVALKAGDRTGTARPILVGDSARHVALTLSAPAEGPACVVFQIGGDLGPVRIAKLRLREGCADVYARRFENGLVLANGSGITGHRFDIRSIGDGRSYRRFEGLQAPDINNGKPVDDSVTLPPLEGLLLLNDIGPVRTGSPEN